jgi:heme oxygenase
MTLLERLRERTGPWHRRLEAELSLLTPGSDERVYARYLGKLWGFHAPVERPCDAREEAALVEAACTTFQGLHRWLVERPNAVRAARSDARDAVREAVLAREGAPLDG